MSELFRFSFDDSGIKKALDTHTADIQRHEEILEELQKMLHDRPTFADMDRMREDIMREVLGKINELEDLVGLMQTTTDKRLSQLHEELTNIEKQGKDGENNDSINENKFKELFSRLEHLESSVDNNTKAVNNTNKNLELMTNNYASIVDCKAPLDDNLETNLRNSTNQIKNKFKNIYTTLSQHSDMLRQKPTVQKEIIRETSTEGFVKQGDYDALNNNINDILKMLDISDFYPGIEEKSPWENPPVLPRLDKFNTVAESVGYTYKMIPKLQAYLYSMHDRMDDLTTSERDFSGLEDLLASLRDNIKDMDKELTQLKSALKKSVTRQDVLDMLRSDDDACGTSIGSVRCIACGREVSQVAGALTEMDALKTLGAPPNSIAVFGTPRVSQMYTSESSLDHSSKRRGCDTGIIESPRSTRSYKASPCRVTRRVRQSPR